MPTLYLLVGLPGSGKTTWRNAFLASRGDGACAVGRDDIVEEAAAAAQGISYAEAWRAGTVKKATDKEFRRRLGLAFQCGCDVVVDVTGLTGKARRRVLDRVPAGWEKVAVLFDLPDEELTRRLRARAQAGGKHIGERLLARMRKSWEPIGPGEVDRVIRPPGCVDRLPESRD